MRLLHLITKLDRGGAQHQVRDLALAQRAAGHTVTVVHGVDGPTADILRAAGMDVVAVPHLRHRPGPVADHRAARAVEALLRERRPEVVHCHSSKGGLVGRIAAARVGVPAVYTAHGWPFRFGAVTHRVASITGEVLCGRLLPAHVVCVSRADLAIARRFVPGHRLHLVRNGILDDPRPADPGADAAVPHVVMVARMERPKDHGAAIALFVAVRDLPWRATFVGGGSLLDRWLGVARSAGLAERIDFTGDLDDPAAVLATAHVQLHLSGYEGLPLAVMEGMRAGLPVLCSGSGGLVELVGAELANDSAPRRAEMLRRLLQDPARRGAEGARMRAAWMDGLDLARTVEGLDRCYEAARRGAS